MKFSIFSTSILCAALLSACGDDKPSDQLASQVIRPYAEKNLIKGLELTDYKRDNGWVDPDHPNRYTVQFNYNYLLTKPFPEAVLELTKDIEADLSNIQRKKTGVLYSSAVAAELEILMSSSKWIESQNKQSLKERAGTLVAQCEQCLEYLTQGSEKDDLKTRSVAFFAAWGSLEKMGFMDDAKVGYKIPGSARATFIKTERGWQEVSD